MIINITLISSIAPKVGNKGENMGVVIKMTNGDEFYISTEEAAENFTVSALSFMARRA